MALTPISVRDLQEIDLIPQAVISRREFDARKGAPVVEFTQDEDDLDRYEGAAFNLDGMPFAIRHYQGHPDGTLTIYLRDNIRNIENILDIIRRIMSELHLPKAALIWDRSKDPDL